MKLLNNSGAALYPLLAINDNPVEYFYASGSGYCDATLNLVLKVEASSVVSVSFQASGNTIYAGHNYICIQRLA